MQVGVGPSVDAGEAIRKGSAGSRLRLGDARALLKDTLDAAASPPAGPGAHEDERFGSDPSVARWRTFQRERPATAVDNLRAAASISASIGSGGGGSYAAAAGLRTSYFAANALLGSLAAEVHERLQAGAGSGGRSGLDIDAATASRLLLETVMVYEQDYRAISEGEYKMPWDMAMLGHRQYTPAYALRQSALFVTEAVATLGRRQRQDAPGVWLGSAPGLYPDYYKNNFHYQTDGWMSSGSAAVYETSTETLFLGRQDAMQRQTLRPLLRALRRTGASAPKVLEVACGTGRFATFVRDNLPRAELTATDLSPFYLEAARENDAYWRRTRPDAPPAAAFVQAAAEALPFADGAFDAVLCVYLFHEMPAEARAQAAAEMARVCAAGGVVVLTDSIQKGDRPALDDRLGNFARLNEPHYEDYVACELSGLFEQCGLQPERKYVASSTKTLSFLKPLVAVPGEGRDA